jgi:protein-disulfide isomerase
MANFMEKYGTALAVLAGAIIIAAVFAFGHGTSTGGNAQQGTQGATASADIKDVKTDGEPYVGSPTAPVTMAFWFDYQCPFCKQFDTTVTTQLYANYVKTGKLRIVFKDFQFLGNDSMTGAEFARAFWAAYPDKFYDWYQDMFVAQDQEGDQGFGNLASIQALTKSKFPDVDVDRVTKLMNDNKAQYDAAIQADRSEGAAMGVNGTPAILIGTTLLAGAQPYATVSGLIDAQLSGK